MITLRHVKEIYHLHPLASVLHWSQGVESPSLKIKLLVLLSTVSEALHLQWKTSACHTPLLKIKLCKSVSVWDRLPSMRGRPLHVSQPQLLRLQSWGEERPIGKKWDSRLSNFTATAIHQTSGRWQWKWRMETDRWPYHFTDLRSKARHGPLDLLSEHDPVHYDCHLRPFLSISTGVTLAGEDRKENMRGIGGQP